VVLPQLAASAVNIAYNLTQIVAQMNDAQEEKFYQTLNIYNVIVYPLAIVAFILAVRPIARCWKSLSDAERLTEGDVKVARRRALGIPRFIAVLTAIGWFPGGIIFPYVIWRTTGLEPSLAYHFVASFVLSGMIALAYSLCGVEFVVLRGLYPGLWRDARHFTTVAREELAPVHRHLNWIEILAGSIPLLAATFVLILGSGSNMTFRLLVAALIFLGLIGSRVTSAITRHLSRVIVALSNLKG
jgi:eukaryotic-like serine/threonine-protein kinase